MNIQHRNVGVKLDVCTEEQRHLQETQLWMATVENEASSLSRDKQNST